MIPLCCQITLGCCLWQHRHQTQGDTMQNPRSYRELVSHFETATQDTESPMVRRWGFEIETPEVGQVGHILDDAQFSLTCDGSVTEGDCSCDCDECSHSCDCSNCRITNGWDSPDHCGNCTTNEASSAVQMYGAPSAKMRQALGELHGINSEDMENGGHIHVDARDLSVSQIEAVIKIWEKVTDTIPRLAGRERNEYCERNSDYGDQHDRLTAKMRAVNASALVQGQWTNKLTAWKDEPTRPALGESVKGPFDGYRTTLEFREFASTARAEIIFARASIVRAIVDYVSEGHAPYWILRSQSEEELIQELKPLEH